MPARFAAAGDEYASATQQAALLDRADRGLVLMSGTDAASWLHNLVTNAVTTLDDGAGNYAFATDVKGRILFDLNILRLPGVFWLDLARSGRLLVLEHFDRYLIMEDVALADASNEGARLGVTGPEAGRIAVELGAANFAALPQLGMVALEPPHVHLLRHDFAGGPGFELFVPQSTAAEWWDRIAAMGGVRPIGWETLEVLRIEAGIPTAPNEINNAVLPPETGQIERGISYHKGCYLGQEIIERMRAHGSLARRLVRVEVAGGDDGGGGGGGGLALPAALMQNGKEVGRLTSLVRHPMRDFRVGLGYLRTSVVETGGITAGEASSAVRVV